MTGAIEALPPRASIGPLDWMRKNLFGTWYNTILTLIALWLLFVVGRAVVTWAFGIADWSPVAANPLLYLVGQYPFEHLWRVGLILLGVSLLFGLSWGSWGGVFRTFALGYGIGLGVIALLPIESASLSSTVRLWMLGNPAIVSVGYLIGRTRIIGSRWITAAWLLVFFVSPVLLRGFDDNSMLPVVDPGQWGGLLLNLMLALAGILASFPLGVLLALGRRSSLPVVRLFSTVYIEVIRGVPLVTILFMATIIFALFLPEDVRLDRIVRAWLGITLFSAAYMAENVRGGLQAVPQAQVEAAKALGLSGPLITLLVVLPQALRNVIPVIVGQFISLFKDTSLVVIVALLDILGIGKSIVLGNVEWQDQLAEVYLFIAAVFWVFSYALSYASRRLEAALGVGKR